MKKLTCLLLVILLLCAAVPAFAETAPIIVHQPQNPTYPEYSVAEYSVTVCGDNLQCAWYMWFEGSLYKISDTSTGIQPWEVYAGETYGPTESAEGDFTTFTYTFGGIGPELDGSTIYAEITNGEVVVYSANAYVSVVEGDAMPPKTVVPASMEVEQGTVLDLYCSATAPDGGELSYVWYETTTGDFRDMMAINRGAETNDTLRIDTSEPGLRWFICGVGTSSGGWAYTSIIPVMVLSAPEVEPPVIIDNTLPEATEGEAYYHKLECTDADAVFGVWYNPGKDNDFEATGLTLTQHGEIEGTPTKAGSYTFTLYASGEGGEGYQTFTLTVLPPSSAATSEATENTEVAETNETTQPVKETEPLVIAPPPSQTPQTTIPPTYGPTEPEAEKGGVPVWAVALIGVSATGAGAGAAWFVIKKKK